MKAVRQRPFFCLLIFIVVTAHGCLVHAEPVSVVKYIDYKGYFARYYIGLLEKVLENTRGSHGDYIMRPHVRHIPSKRVLKETERGDALNLMWAPVSERLLESGMINIPIPLMKGLAGYRVMIVRAEDESRFGSVKSLNDLSDIVVGQKTGWGDVEVYKHNGIQVVTSATFDSLFRMVSAKRFDAFPMGVDNVESTFNEYNKTNYGLRINQNLLIRYSWNFNFFVNENYPELSERIELGLRDIQESGEFDKYFFDYFGELIQRLNLSERTIIRLENQFLDLDDKNIPPSTLPESNRHDYENIFVEYDSYSESDNKIKYNTKNNSAASMERKSEKAQAKKEKARAGSLQLTK